MAVGEQIDTAVIELTVDDADDFDALYAELRGVSGIAAEAVPAAVAPGDQGSILDLLTVACSGGAITVFLEIIKNLLESRGEHFVLKVRRGRDRLEIKADNVEELLPALKELLGGE